MRTTTGLNTFNFRYVGIYLRYVGIYLRVNSVEQSFLNYCKIGLYILIKRRLLKIIPSRHGGDSTSNRYDRVVNDIRSVILCNKK